MNTPPINIYLRWCLLVSLNAIVTGFFITDILKTPQGALGIFTAIMTFVFVYAKLDMYLIRGGDDSNKIKWRKSLYIGVVIKAFLQIFILLELILGAVAVEISNQFLGLDVLSSENWDFFPIYFTTLIDGLFLSIVTGMIELIIRLGYTARKDYAKQYGQ